MEKELFSSEDIAIILNLTKHAINYRIRRLRIKFVKKEQRKLLFSFDQYLQIKNFIEFTSAKEFKKSIFISSNIIYVTQTYHIYESKINFML